MHIHPLGCAQRPLCNHTTLHYAITLIADCKKIHFASPQQVATQCILSTELCPMSALQPLLYYATLRSATLYYTIQWIAMKHTSLHLNRWQRNVYCPLSCAQCPLCNHCYTVYCTNSILHYATHNHTALHYATLWTAIHCNTWQCNAYCPLSTVSTTPNVRFAITL